MRTTEEARLRHAACLLADIGWRAHPEYRGEQSLNLIAHAAFIGIDHPGRAYLALANFYRHEGLIDEALSPHIREIASTRLMERARALGATLRVAYLISGAMPDVVGRTRDRGARKAPRPGPPGRPRPARRRPRRAPPRAARQARRPRAGDGDRVGRAPTGSAFSPCFFGGSVFRNA